MRLQCYNVLSTIEKQAAAKQTFVFLVLSNEQRSDEIGHRARQRDFASEEESAYAVKGTSK